MLDGAVREDRGDRGEGFCKLEAEQREMRRSISKDSDDSGGVE